MATPENSGYQISADPVYKDSQIARYATPDPTIFIESFIPAQVTQGAQSQDFDSYLEIYDELRLKLIDLGLQSYVPEIVDSDVDDHWVAFGVTAGLYSLSEVRNSFPDGIDGRDWAWIFRRILMVLNSGDRRPHLTEENILIQPEEHGAVLLGWHPIEDPDVYPLDQLKSIMERNLRKSADSEQQIALVGKLADAYRADRKGQQIKSDPSKPLFSYDEVISEYTLKLTTIYGPRRFRPLVLDSSLSRLYLGEESSIL